MLLAGLMGVIIGIVAMLIIGLSVTPKHKRNQLLADRLPEVSKVTTGPKLEAAIELTNVLMESYSVDDLKNFTFDRMVEELVNNLTVLELEEQRQLHSSEESVTIINESKTTH